MRRRLVPAILLIACFGLLIKFVVFKSGLDFHIGHVRLKFDDPRPGPPNFVPFRTIGSYLHRWRGFISLINIVGNIAPFVPVGLLAPFVYPKMTWQKSFVLAVATGLAMEVMEVVFQVGTFDVDDIILNAFGVMIGYWVFAAFKGGAFTDRRPSTLPS